jgi:hypothetical protein
MMPGRSMSALIFRMAEKRIPRAEEEKRASWLVMAPQYSRAAPAVTPRSRRSHDFAIFLAAGLGTRVIFRSGGPDARFLPVSVLRRLHFERERAERLHRQDRVGTYGSFHIARFAPAH